MKAMKIRSLLRLAGTPGLALACTLYLSSCSPPSLPSGYDAKGTGAEGSGQASPTAFRDRGEVEIVLRLPKRLATFQTKFIPDETESFEFQVEYPDGRPVLQRDGQKYTVQTIRLDSPWQTVNQLLVRSGLANSGLIHVRKTLADLPVGEELSLRVRALKDNVLLAQGETDFKVQSKRELAGETQSVRINLVQALEFRERGDGVGTVQGRVVTARDGQPLAYARVLIPAENGADRDLIVETDAQGQFSLRNVRAGRKVVIISKAGQSTRIEVTVVREEVHDLGEIPLAVYTGPAITTPPEITILSPTDLGNNVVRGNSPIFTIHGKVKQLESNEIAFVINGAQEKISVGSDGGFSHVVILTQPGENEIIVRAANAVGISQKRILVDYQENQIGIHVKLQWDTNFSDIDLHVEDPLGRHTYYRQKQGIPDSQLDVDDTNGYGPENFTMQNVPVSVPGRYKIGVRYFDSHGLWPLASKCFVEVTLNAGTPQRVHRDFEQVLSASAQLGEFPGASSDVSWRVTDVLVKEDGTAAIVEPE